MWRAVQRRTTTNFFFPSLFIQALKIRSPFTSPTTKQGQSLLVARPLGPARDALQRTAGDGSAEANAGGAQLRPSSPSAALAASANDSAAAAEDVIIGGGIFKAISDAASQEGPLQGLPFDSNAYGPPVRQFFFFSFSFPFRKKKEEIDSARDEPSFFPQPLLKKKTILSF